MLKHEIANQAAQNVLTEEQLELVSGGDDGTGNIPICPPWPPGPGPHWPVHMGDTVIVVRS